MVMQLISTLSCSKPFCQHRRICCWASVSVPFSPVQHCLLSVCITGLMSSSDWEVVEEAPAPAPLSLSPSYISASICSAEELSWHTDRSHSLIPEFLKSNIMYCQVYQNSDWTLNRVPNGPLCYKGIQIRKYLQNLKKIYVL